MAALLMAGVGVYLCIKMIASYPRNQDDHSPQKTQADMPTVDGASI